ncbi:MAG TPA: peptidase, partial [Deltaproteobacteria bacterium]|nr:peptidase [Deltaproteobacteria bacterium]
RPDGTWHRLELAGNVAAPQWIGSRIAFIGDEQGTAALYSCTADGGDRTLHAEHGVAPVRFLDGDGERLVYVSGGDLWLWRPGEAPTRVEVEVRSQGTWQQRRFPAASRYLEDVDLHPDGHSLALIVRGRPCTLGSWEGPVRQLGARDGVRYGLARWIDADRLLVVSDASGEKGLEILAVDGTPAQPLATGDLGNPVEIEIAPGGRWAAISDHRQILTLVDLTEAEPPRVLEEGTHGRPSDLAWSSDGAWLAWSLPRASWGQRASIRLLKIDEADAPIVSVTDGHYRDTSPSFDPGGAHLYFLSSRSFDPVMDTQFFGYGFVRGTQPYLVTLRRDVPHPLQAAPGEPDEPSGDDDALEIELEGISDRIVALPVAEGRYESIFGVGGGEILLTREQIKGTLDRTWQDTGPPKADRQLLSWSFDKRELTLLNGAISRARISQGHDQLALRSGWRLRVVPARPDRGQRDELKKTQGRTTRKEMWIDLARVRISIDPVQEWRQMIDEAWRLMRDHFWRPSMGGVDWEEVRGRYRDLVERISTRSELSDLIWSMQGELGTSHAYELGGDHRRTPTYPVGRLGADLTWDPRTPGWRITRIVRGEPGDPKRSSPLLAPGADVSEGDVITAIGGLPVEAMSPPGAALVNQAGTLVELSVATSGDRRTSVIKTLSSDRGLRYRDWVLTNRRTVHDASGGRLGYVHIPDMGPGGFAEFHRDFLHESSCDGLLVDVRYNRGGHVSQLLLDRLARRRLGYGVPRYGLPTTYPAYSVLGPMVCLTNEMAGSDGDIFSHAWKLMGLGPLVGTRTWGGVVGISPRTALVDQSITTQPEYSTWFQDVGYGLENHGTDPDEIVGYPPEAWASGIDPQLQRGITLLKQALQAAPPVHPQLRGEGPPA